MLSQTTCEILVQLLRLGANTFSLYLVAMDCFLQIPAMPFPFNQTQLCAKVRVQSPFKEHIQLPARVKSRNVKASMFNLGRRMSNLRGGIPTFTITDHSTDHSIDIQYIWAFSYQIPEEWGKRWDVLFAATRQNQDRLAELGDREHTKDFMMYYTVGNL